MKTSAVTIPVLAILIAASLSVLPAYAEDGATLYQTKCAACHGVDGAGKPAANIPSLISNTAQSATDADLADRIAYGDSAKDGGHAIHAKGLSPDHVKMILAYIRQLQKK